MHSIDIPESVTSIGDNAFTGSGLEKINLPKRLVSIGNSAFKNCELLEEIVVPESVTVIGNLAFAWSGIKKLVLPDNITHVVSDFGSLFWEGCSSLEELHLPNKMTFLPYEIGDSGIEIKVMNLPASLTRSDVRLFPENLENIIGLISSFAIKGNKIEIHQRKK